MSSSKINRFLIISLFLKESSPIGLNLLRKIGKKESKTKFKTISVWQEKINKIKAVIKNKIVPIEAFQIKAKTKRGIRDQPRIWGLRVKKAPIKVPIPRPPANLRKQDQLLPTTTATPQ